MTPEREQKIKRVLSKKQLDLTVVLENVDDPHNISAVLRSCDAVGIKEVFLLDTKQLNEYQLGKKSSASAVKWMDVHQFNDLEACMKAVRSRYKKVLTTHLHSEAKSIYECDFTQSTALVFGNEKDGISDELLELSDGNIVIPQVGMIASLNISVACAVTLYEAFRQRQQKDLYSGDIHSANLLEDMFMDWSER